MTPVEIGRLLQDRMRVEDELGEGRMGRMCCDREYDGYRRNVSVNVVSPGDEENILRDKESR